MQIQKVNSVNFKAVRVSGVSNPLIHEVNNLGKIKGFANLTEAQAKKKLAGGNIALILGGGFTFVCNNKETEEKIAKIAKKLNLYIS